ncbi:MAG TPA: peptidoglycan DD-metalloendopeptidase family protein, partial [Bacteroidales bacterium]|nr:peptidoglycan DD-metalloendopeptidase family protein [Bacteroidales bacterium]
AWYTSEILSSTDYYPFGFQMPGRVYEADGYRYGFNGMEKDDELKGSGNSYDFGARIYDPRVGRWLAVDPFFYKVPSMTPYRFGFCSPLTYKDINGLLEAPLFGTVLYYEHVVKKIVKSFIQKAIKSLGHKRQEYNYAFESIQYLPPKTTEQKQAESNGMLIVVTSNFFKIRSVGSSPHLGVDFRAKEGTNVYSFGDGVVVSSGEADGIGKFVVIEYSNGDKVRFGHLSSINEFKKGEKVLEGQIIGKSGKTGGNYAAHLHVDAVDKDGRLVDPLTRSYGTTSNKEFFEKFGGDALKLKEYKEEKIKESKEMQQAILSVQLKKDEISRHDRIPYVKNQTQQ